MPPFQGSFVLGWSSTSSSSGTMVAIGAPSFSVENNGRVSAYSWCEQWDGTAWNIVGAEITKIMDIQFGISVSLTANGLWILCNNWGYYHLNVASISCIYWISNGFERIARCRSSFYANLYTWTVLRAALYPNMYVRSNQFHDE